MQPIKNQPQTTSPTVNEITSQIPQRNSSVSEEMHSPNILTREASCAPPTESNIDIQKEYQAILNIFKNCADEGVDLNEAKEVFYFQFQINYFENDLDKAINELPEDEIEPLIEDYINYRGRLPSEEIDTKIITQDFLEAWDQIDNRTDNNPIINLDYSGKRLKLIPSNLPYYCRKLEMLNLSETWIEAIPSEIEYLYNLKILNCKGTDVTSIPSELKKLKNLENLNIDTDEMVFLPGQFKEIVSNLKMLKELKIANSNLSEIPPELFELINLEVLSIQSSKIKTISPDIEKLKNLKELDLYANDIETLPSTLSNLKELKELYLCWNEFKSRPECLDKFTQAINIGIDEDFTEEIKKRKVEKD